MKANRFYVKSNRTGFMMDNFETFDEAQEAVDKYTAEDFAKGDRRVYMYDITDEDGLKIVQYTLKIKNASGIRNDVVYDHVGYTAQQYKLDHGLDDSTEVSIIDERGNW